MKRSRPVLLALVGLFVWLTACTSYKRIGIGEVADHAKVRVTLTGGQRETLHDPRVEADSIKGHVKSGRPSPQLVDRAVPLDRVAELGAVGTDEVGTVFTTLAILVGVTAIALAAICPTTTCFNVY